MSINNKGYLILSLIVMIGGIVTYVGWGFTYNAWLDIGIFSIFMFMFVAGLIGALLAISSE